MNRLLHWLVNAVWSLAVFILLLLALYAGVGRYLITQVDVYQGDLENLLSERLGRPVQIDSLTGTWAGLDPVIRIEGLRVGAADKPDAALQRLRIRLATASSLVRGRLVFSEFSASHADLTLTQDRKGVLGLAGLWQPPIEEVTGLELLEAAVQDFDDSFADWIEELGRILADPVVRVSDLRLTLRAPDHDDQHYQIPAIDLAFRRGIFSAQGRLARVDNSDTIAWFTLEGRHFFSGRFDGSVYLDIRSERLFDTFLQQYEWFDVGVQGLDLRTALWLDFSAGEVSRALARLESPYLQLRSPTMTLPPIEDLGVTLALQRQEQAPCNAATPCEPQWDLQARDLRYSWRGQKLGPTNLRWSGHAGSWQLGVDTLAIDSLAQLMVSLEVLPAAASTALVNYRPRGELSQLNVDYRHPGDYRLSAMAHQLGVDAHGGAPVIDGLDGWLEHDSRGGSLLYDASEVVFGFPDLFVGAWQFQRMTGELAWHAESKTGWQVQGRDLRFQYSGETRLGGAFELNLAPGQPIDLSLGVGLVNAGQRHLAQFIPLGAVGEPLYDWITGAIVDAEIPWGWYYGSGALGRREPAGNDESDGSQESQSLMPARYSSAMVYDFKDVTLRYSEDWPALEQGRGQFRYQAGRGWVDVEAAQLGGLTPRPSRVRIDTRAGPTRIDITSGARVNGENLLHWLKNTTLGPMAGDRLDALEVAGAGDLALGLTVFPGAPTEAQSIDLSLGLALDGLSIVHQASGYGWQDLTGTVRYDNHKGLSSADLEGRFLQHQARFKLTGGAPGQPLEIHQSGRATVAELSEALNRSEAPEGGSRLPLQGAFDYNLRASGGEQPLLGFQVNLLDVAVDLPAPLGKPMGAAGLVQGNLVAEGDGRLRLQGAWDDRLAYQAVWGNAPQGEDQKWQPEQASLVLGEETAVLRPGRYFLGGRIKSLDLDQWLQTLGPLVSQTNTAAEPAVTTDLTDWPMTVALATDQLRAGGVDFGAVDLRLEPAGEDWWIDLQGPQLAGSIRWQAEGPHRVELERLKLAADALSASSAAHEEGAQKVNQASQVEYPAVDVAIAELWLGEADYGRWGFQLRPAPQALTVRALEGHTGSMTFQGELVWEYDPAGQDRTRLSGDLKGRNIRDLNAWIEAGVPLDSKSTSARLDLNWPGPPQSFSVATLEGEMALGLKDGTILDQNNAAQVFRVFGLLNADTLMRRLRLDFSDLYKPGVSFEALSGSAIISNGVLSLNPELQLTGPSGAFRLTGSTDLLEESLDMKLVVVLPLTQNLPVAALLFGAAAPIGGALFILDKLLGDPLSKLTSATYDVSGGWDKPNVKLRNFFDTGNDRKAVERPADGGAE